MIEENSWYSQISLAYIHFLYFLFGNNFKCRDVRARKVPRTPISPLPRFASYSTFAPPAVSFAFFHCTFSHIHVHTLSHIHTWHPHAHTWDTTRIQLHTHSLSFVGFLWDVLFENNKEASEGGRFGMKRRVVGEGEPLQLGDGSIAWLPSPCCQCKQQALKCSGLGLTYYMDRDQKKYLLHKTVILVFFFRQWKPQKKTQQSIYMNHGNSFITQNHFYNICYNGILPYEVGK